MKIIETAVFTRQVKALLNDEQYRELQNEIIAKPETGKIIRGSGGLRKIRWAGSGRGKRGGTRTIYFWFKSAETILMLLIYTKKEKDDLTPEQVRILKNVVENELK